ncbi:hypothetical protein MLD38_027454 [Melastoma candidum]|uniref:Uncharacterized protein n=1 Tax=Melastoma candidum TaxID=119954 RepID=A0ACB9P4S8_9MYRT|nr:hypothetical protein MLD38_027454 [Melastoma candidum]
MKRRGVPRMWQAVPCASRRTTRTDSQKDIEAILKTKLGTIQEEPESPQDPGFLMHGRRRAVRKGMRKLDARAIMKMGRRFVSRFSFADSYAIFSANFAGRGGSLGVLILK